MKTLLSLIFLAGLTTLAPAAPYIVYSGVANGGNFSDLGTARKITYIYLVTDIADSSSFALMQLDSTGKVYTVNSRPSSASPSTEETNNNFIGGITATNGKSGIASFSYSSDTTDLSNNIFISHAYSTGAATLRNTVLVPARRVQLIVKLRVNGVLTGTSVTFNPTAAVTTGMNAFTTNMSGNYFNYEIAAAGPLATVSTKGSFTLTVSSLMTTLANIGGGYTTGTGVTLNTTAIQPINIPMGTPPATAATTYSAWLAAFAQQIGYTLPVSPAINTEAFGTP